MTSTYKYCSFDPYEIAYICNDPNIGEFKKRKVDVNKISGNNILFTSENEDSLKEGMSFLQSIIEKYRKPVRRSVVVEEQYVGFIGGKKSEHIKQLKERTGVKEVYFNNVVSKDDVKMVEIVVYGDRLSVDRMMSEILRSVSTLMQRNNKFEMPSQDERRERRERDQKS